MIVKILEKSSGKIINHNFNHASFPEPISGLDTAVYEILVPKEENVLPEYDSRFYMIVENPDVISNTILVEGYRTVATVKTLERNSTEAIIAAVDEAKVNANNQIVKLEKQVETLIVALNAILRDAQGLTLTNKENAAKTKIGKYAVKVLKNADNYENLIAAINTGNNPNIDLGWEVNE